MKQHGSLGSSVKNGQKKQKLFSLLKKELSEAPISLKNGWKLQPIISQAALIAPAD